MTTESPATAAFRAVRDLLQATREDYQAARNASKWGKPDPSLEDTVNGILKFMHRKGIISVEPRELNAVASG